MVRLSWLAIYSQYRNEEGAFEIQLRRILFRALCKSAGQGLRVEPEVIVKHPETMEFGNSVFIGAQTMIQGRFDGTCRIGNHVWIGPHAYFDARDLILEDYVGWGPGAKVLGSSHTGAPIELPIIATPLKIKQVVVGFGADIGTNATIASGSSYWGAFHRRRGSGCHRRCAGICHRRWYPSKVIRFRK